MSPKDILFDKLSREKIMSGAKQVYEAVSATYGPQSGNVMIEKNWGPPIISHDGVTVAREVRPVDPHENMGAQIIIEASEKTNAVAGDGTSVTVILACQILMNAIQAVGTGANAMDVKRGIYSARDKIIGEIAGLANPVGTKDQLRHVAQISAGDDAIGAMIADVVDTVGINGGVNVEEHHSTITESEILDGFHFASGFESEYFINEVDRAQVVYSDMLVIVADKHFRTVADIKPIAEKISKTGKKKLLIIGRVSGDALTFLIKNKFVGALESVTVTPPTLGDQRLGFLEDVARITNASVITEAVDGDQINLTHLGSIGNVVVKRNSTSLMNVAATSEEVEQRVKEVEEQYNAEKNAYVREYIEKRLNMLKGKIGIIRVGGATETERKELRLRVDDAVSATRAAMEDGIVPGGATVMLRLSKKAGDTEHIGERVVYQAMAAPFTVMMANAGYTHESKVEKLLTDENEQSGYNVRTEEYVANLLEAGIIDPAKVLKQAVENACSIAGQAITTKATIAIDKDELLKLRRFNETE